MWSQKNCNCVVQKPTKAQKRREKAAEAEAAREARIADANAELGDSDRVLEERALAELLAPLGAGVRDITVRGYPDTLTKLLRELILQGLCVLQMKPFGHCLCRP